MFSVFFFFKQKTAYELLISDWSSDVCSSSPHAAKRPRKVLAFAIARFGEGVDLPALPDGDLRDDMRRGTKTIKPETSPIAGGTQRTPTDQARAKQWRSEEHTSELQSLMRTSYAVFCLKKKKQKNT